MKRHGPHNGLNDLPNDAIIDAKGRVTRLREIDRMPDADLKVLTRQLRSVARHAQGPRREKAAAWTAVLNAECRRRQLVADEPRRPTYSSSPAPAPARTKSVEDRTADARAALCGGTDAQVAARADAVRKAMRGER